MGARFPRTPYTEDERMEYQQMKVYQHRAASISFEN